MSLFVRAIKIYIQNFILDSFRQIVTLTIQKKFPNLNFPL